jgi:hypothetical protein
VNNEFLRHTLATIEYRFSKAVENSNTGFGDFNIGKGSRSPKQIINHMYHVLSFSRVFMENGNKHHPPPEELDLSNEINRFILEINMVDKVLANKELNLEYSKKILQGPFSDILTHIGQIAMLQRLDDRPIDKEDFSAAKINTEFK